MRAVVQRVSEAGVTIDGKVKGKIGKGFMVLLGVGKEDTDADLDYLVKKITNLRVFEDHEGKMNLALKDIDGEMLVISQFTLYASTRKGNRPSFVNAGAPEPSEKMYLEFVKRCNAEGIHTECGKFGADMKVTLINDGPVTIIYDSKDPQ